MDTEAPYRLGTAVVDVEGEHFSSNVFLNLAEGAGRAAPARYRSSGDPGDFTIEQPLAALARHPTVHPRLA